MKAFQLFGFFARFLPLIFFALPVSAGPVLLTFTHGDQVTIFDRDMLLAMQAQEFTTKTAWTEGPQNFKGVPLHVFLEKLDIGEGVLSATAVNDYAVEIPVSDAVENGPIIAYERNGAAMSLRDKGPLWIVYPYDANPDYQSEVIYSRSIWQLNRISWNSDQ